MQDAKEHNYYKWSVGKGDYKRDDEATTSFAKKQLLKKRIKRTLMIILYFTTVTGLSFLLFGKF